ncbi:MAG: radical SAM protein [Armatimonadetes bacterium]|nr:radical SAM protein [Armatimonadota bacterium]
MAEKRVLLLNPPNPRLCIRDYYHSKTSKTNYLFPPIELVVLSGILSTRHEVDVLDAIADRMPDEKCLEKIAKKGYDAIVTLMGDVSFGHDVYFLQQVRARTRAPLFAMGDCLLETPEQRLRELPFLDGILLDFTNQDIVRFLGGDRDQLHCMAYRDGEKTVESIAPWGEKEFEIPVPRHELFTSRSYRFPLVRNPRFTTMLTDYGCRFKCTFCVSGTLGHKQRPAGNVIQEMKHVYSLGIREIFFEDNTFRSNKLDNRKLCEAMIEADLGMGWVCFSRVDVVDETTLALMKRAGCHTIIFGVESAAPEILKRYRKGYTLEKVRTTFQLCRKLGIRTVGTFLFGLPEDTWETCRKTINLAVELDCDYASFNMAVPRAHTGLREIALQEGLVSADLRNMDQSGAEICMPTRHLTIEQLKRIKRNFVTRFYLRPSYFLKRLRGIGNFYELRENLSEALALFRGIL